MKVTLVDSKLIKHVIPEELDGDTDILTIKVWIHDNLTAPKNTTFVLVYNKKILGNFDTLKSIDYNPEKSITIVNINSQPLPLDDTTLTDDKLFSSITNTPLILYDSTPTDNRLRKGGSRSKRSARRKKMARTRTIAKRRNTQRITLRRRHYKK